MTVDLVAVGTWLIAAVGVPALWYLGRLKEMHHLYLGVGLSFAPWWWVRLVGFGLAVDDVAFQHVEQALRKLEGRPIPADFSPLHTLYVAAARWLIRQPWCPAVVARFLSH